MRELVTCFNGERGSLRSLRLSIILTPWFALNSIRNGLGANNANRLRLPSTLTTNGPLMPSNSSRSIHSRQSAPIISLNCRPDCARTQKAHCGLSPRYDRRNTLQLGLYSYNNYINNTSAFHPPYATNNRYETDRASNYTEPIVQQFTLQH